MQEQMDVCECQKVRVAGMRLTHYQRMLGDPSTRKWQKADMERKWYNWWRHHRDEIASIDPRGRKYSLFW